LEHGTVAPNLPPKKKPTLAGRLSGGQVRAKQVGSEKFRPILESAHFVGWAAGPDRH